MVPHSLGTTTFGKQIVNTPNNSLQLRLNVRAKKDYMKIHLRYRKGENLEYDRIYSISSQEEWKELVYDPRLISSILWPDKDLFGIKSKHVNRKHCHEVNYQDDFDRNLSYLNGCREIAAKLEIELSGGATK